MSQPIPSNRQTSPPLITPTSTPPGQGIFPSTLFQTVPAGQSRLHQLLGMTDDGLQHSSSSHPGMSMTMGHGNEGKDAHGTSPESSRRPSFLSSLKPQFPHLTLYPIAHSPSSSQPTSPTTSSQPIPLPTGDIVERSKSTPAVPQSLSQLEKPESSHLELDLLHPSSQQPSTTLIPGSAHAQAHTMQRSRSVNFPIIGGWMSSFRSHHHYTSPAGGANLTGKEEKRHFDPSKEPRLLGII